MRESYIFIFIVNIYKITILFFTGYFICPGVGKYADPTMFDQGKYFECTNVGGGKTMQKIPFCIIINSFYFY
jgi:hypothetical protein